MMKYSTRGGDMRLLSNKNLCVDREDDPVKYHREHETRTSMIPGEMRRLCNFLFN